MPTESRSLKPPATRREDIHESMHGVEMLDSYHWLEDEQRSETREWIGAQNDYAQAHLHGLPMRAHAERRLTEMLAHDSLSFPIDRNGRFFFSKRGSHQEFWNIYLREGANGNDELLVDTNQLGAGTAASAVLFAPSNDGALLIYGVRRGGEDETEIHVLDVETKRDLSDRLPRGLHQDFGWCADRSGFYYSLARRDVGRRIYFHSLGTDSNDDKEVFGEGYPRECGIFPLVSEDGRYLLASVWWGWSKMELYMKDLRTEAPFRPLVRGIDAKFRPQFAGEYLIVQTDWHAPNGRILKIYLRDPAIEKWQEVVPEGDDAIQSFSILGNRILVTYLHNATSRIETFSLQGEPLGDISLPTGTAAIFGRYGQDEGTYFCSSFTTSYSIYRYNALTSQTVLWHRDAVPFESDLFEMKQKWFNSKDGTRVPMFLIMRKGLLANGARPTVLYGYGGFAQSLTPSFSAGVAWWIEQGGVFAVANLRGGGEFGESWHRAGMLERKQNVFDDMIGAAEWLVSNEWTNSQKLAIWGLSNGGLLVGAVTTQRPNLVRAVLCQHPDLDLVRFHRYSKGNNPPALLEYGDPANPEQFRFIYAYSPYDHVVDGEKYPAVLFTTGDADTRVPPAQARKMTARIQAATASDLPILLLHDTDAGHAGEKPFSKLVQDLSLHWGFLAWQLGLECR